MGKSKNKGKQKIPEAVIPVPKEEIGTSKEALIGMQNELISKQQTFQQPEKSPNKSDTIIEEKDSATVDSLTIHPQEESQNNVNITIENVPKKDMESPNLFPEDEETETAKSETKVESIIYEPTEQKDATLVPIVEETSPLLDSNNKKEARKECTCCVII